MADLEHKRVLTSFQHVAQTAINKSHLFRDDTFQRCVPAITWGHTAQLLCAGTWRRHISQPCPSKTGSWGDRCVGIKRRGAGAEGCAPSGALGSMGVAPISNRSLAIGAGDRGFVLFKDGVVVIHPVDVTDALVICGIQSVLFGIPGVCRYTVYQCRCGIVLALVNGDLVPAHGISGQEKR